MARTGGDGGNPALRLARMALVGFTLLAAAAVTVEVIRSDVSTTFEPRARRPAAVVTDGRRILEIETRTGRVAATLSALPVTAGERIVALAPRPGPLQGLPLMVLSLDGDGPLLWWLDENGQRRDLPEDLARPEVHPDLDGLYPVPMWSPDASHVAWLEGTPARPALRVAAWAPDGPRPGDERHTLSALGLGIGRGGRIEAWRWDTAGPAATGRLMLSDDRPGLYELSLRADEGAVRPLNGRPRRLPGALIDRADATRNGVGPPAPRYSLVLPMERAGRPQLRWSTADGASGTVPLPAGLGGNRARWWLDAFGGLILVGDGARAWALEPNGRAVEIPGRVVHGAALQRVPDADRPVLPSPAPGRRLE